MADDFSQFPEVAAGSSATDEFSAFPEVGASSPSVKMAPAGQQGSAALEAAGRSAFEGVGVMGGAALGAGMGAPLGPGGMIAGGLIGGGIGFKAGEMAAEGWGLRSPEQMPPEIRPGGYAGQSLGGSAAFGSAPYALARAGLRFGESMVGRLLNQIVETAKTRPLLTGISEITTATSAAAGAGGAEIVAPGEAGKRIAAETVAGIVNPTNLAVHAATFAGGIAGKALQSVSPAARETAAGKVLAELLSVTGEDPTVLARILRQPGILPDTEVTAAQKSGSVALAALSDYLSKQNARYGAESSQKARDAMDVVRAQITLLSGTGDPAALAAAAQIRGAYYRTLIQTRVEGAKVEALGKSAKITADTPATRELLSEKARTALEKAITEARTAERDMWARVDDTVAVETSNIQQTYDDIVGDLLPEVRGEKVPKVVRNFLERVTTPTKAEFDYDPTTMSVKPMEQGVKGTTAGEMKQLRSELLDLARTSDRAGEFGQARIYNQMAEAVLDDMDTAFRKAGSTAYDEARTFTRELNDTFTRSFAGKVVAQGKYGDRVAPELLLRKALATGKEAGALQMKELEEATRFMVQRGLGDDVAVRDMLDAQERMIRLAAADSINPNTGRASIEKITTFIKNNATLMNRFPEVKADLLAASKSEQGLRRLEDRAMGIDSVISKQRDFGFVMGSTSLNPAMAAEVARKAATRVVVSADQEAELARLVKMAQGGGAGLGGRVNVSAVQATEGLRTAVFNSVLDKSTRNGVLDASMVRQFLFTPTSVGKKPLMQVMQEQGLVDDKVVKGVRDLFDAAGAVQRSTRPGTAIDVKQDAVDMVTGTLSRMLGSGLAGGAAKAAGSTSPSLIVHGAGARLAENVMTKLPVTTTNKILVEAMNSPEKMASLLEKAPNPQQAAFKARQVHAWLVQSGFTATQELMQPAPQSEPPRRLLAPATR